ncbi:MAG: enoyl-CoA hydratase/isomerase family protein [Xanthomonadales bacterium]|nr:enoyl-CoA hydratase/isomerase family protein [Xanthomonadales bacterium]
MFEGLRFKHWRHELAADGILILTLDRAGESANSLSREVLEELGRLVERIGIEPPKGVVIRSGKSGSFVVGADLREFEQFAAQGQVLESIERGHRVYDALAALRCPTVAAIHGACMGGGTELGLACRWRVATRDPKTRIGLPEVKLGIMPGWGGTSRLPHLVGAPKAFDLMLTGRALGASAARALGYLDAVCDEAELLDAAKRLVARRPARPLAQRTLAWATNTWPVRQVLAPMIRGQTAAKADPKQYPAPFAMIELWRRHGGSVGAMLRAEPRAVARLAATPTARNLVRVYFLQEALKSAGKGEHGVRHVHVVGAGVMGGDIAAWCALQGFTVSLQDRELKYVQPALDRAADLFTRRLKVEPKIGEARARLVADVEGAKVPEADLVIEAIFENSEAKQALYASLEPRLKPGAMLATNTSSIPLATLAEKLADRSRFVGLHYFNPVALMPLVEIVRQPELAPEVERRLLAFARAIDKLPVPVAPSPGFLVNRILMPYLLEAMTAWNEGVPGPVIDRAAKKFGMPMGPIELADTIGLDVAASVGRILAPFLGLEIPKGLESLLANGKRGKKDGQGLYTWVEGKAQKPEVPKDFAVPGDLGDRLVLPMINEAVACLAEGVVTTEEQLDAGVIFGTGFAPFRGGPIQFVRDTGAAALMARLDALAAKYGPRFKPKAGWDRFG